ncbi:ubiquitin carboxyl-terminal hydrolase 49-like isoform X2 [Petromyzon marinus]|uniref:ubiquitinyl hydrolase 1 n=1 Tax=Petromyzon marinus TaxID=7757 RepID=A0AAJ7X909_PETMA|nr:ubiquitin carboxyl-terminal hydrolase 49-like isoform X2 [Petromyzon marinus]
MDRCRHVWRLKLSQNHSILNPDKWACVDCAGCCAVRKTNDGGACNSEGGGLPVDVGGLPVDVGGGGAGGAGHTGGAVCNHVCGGGGAVCEPHDVSGFASCGTAAAAAATFCDDGACDCASSVWACLTCPHVACGRDVAAHADRHAAMMRHPLAMHVAELYVFCFACDDYVLNDNAQGDLKLLRGALGTVRARRGGPPGGLLRGGGGGSTGGGGRALRSAGGSGEACTWNRAGEARAHANDRLLTALKLRRLRRLRRAFGAWFGETGSGRARLEEGRRREEAERRREAQRARRAEHKRQLREEMSAQPPRKSARLATRAHYAIGGGDGDGARPGGGGTSRAWRSRQLERAMAALKRQSSMLTPGVTGLRNLGNTCYMNSILQVLSHLHKFRECFLALDMSEGDAPPAPPPPSPAHGGGETRGPFPLIPSSSAPPSSAGPLGDLLDRAASAGRLARVSTRSVHKLLQARRAAGIVGRAPGQTARAAAGPAGSAAGPAGLGGGGSGSARSLRLLQSPVGCPGPLSLCRELHTLFRVMWSGKWALVSPFAMLHSVWRLIPAFKGYGQQDAQEFLCELLDRVQRELEGAGGRGPPLLIPLAQRTLLRHVLQVVNTIFQGQLLSQVTCMSCLHKSDTVEPFWDLSLEFPARYHCVRKRAGAHGRSHARARAHHPDADCSLTEMLSKFTETEALEGKIYACSFCNSKQRGGASKPLVLTEARKQLLVCRLPQVLRLHLKRFRWSGRNQREKIGVHVAFTRELSMRAFCSRSGARLGGREGLVYDLSAVVMHHGRGFGSGHYTAYVYNTEGGFWVHCNDSEMSVCSVEEVCRAQAYILFYSQRKSPDDRICTTATAVPETRVLPPASVPVAPTLAPPTSSPTPPASPKPSGPEALFSLERRVAESFARPARSPATDGEHCEPQAAPFTPPAPPFTPPAPPPLDTQPRGGLCGDDEQDLAAGTPDAQSSSLPDNDASVRTLLLHPQASERPPPPLRHSVPGFGNLLDSVRERAEPALPAPALASAEPHQTSAGFWLEAQACGGSGGAVEPGPLVATAGPAGGGCSVTSEFGAAAERS